MLGNASWRPEGLAMAPTDHHLFAVFDYEDIGQAKRRVLGEAAEEDSRIRL